MNSLMDMINKPNTNRKITSKKYYNKSFRNRMNATFSSQKSNQYLNNISSKNIFKRDISYEILSERRTNTDQFSPYKPSKKKKNLFPAKFNKSIENNYKKLKTLGYFKKNKIKINHQEIIEKYAFNMFKTKENCNYKSIPKIKKTKKSENNMKLFFYKNAVSVYDTSSKFYICLYKSGEVFFGKTKTDLIPNGKGIYFFNDLSFVSGNFIQGVLDGRVLYKKSNGNFSILKFKKGKFEGISLHHNQYQSSSKYL